MDSAFEQASFVVLLSSRLPREAFANRSLDLPTHKSNFVYTTMSGTAADLSKAPRGLN